MDSRAGRDVADLTLVVAAIVYCGAMLAVLGVGLYGVFSLFQLMFGSLEQTSLMTTWL